jgi:hypothetical protein
LLINDVVLLKVYVLPLENYAMMSKALDRELINDIIDYLVDKRPEFEVNVFWNKADKKIEFHKDTVDESKNKDLLRIGTIGSIDFKTAGVNTFVGKDGKEMYEFDDGKDGFNRPHVSSQLGFTPKRTMLDSSFGGKEQLKEYLKEKADTEKWYQKMLDACCDEHKKKAAGLVN